MTVVFLIMNDDHGTIYIHIARQNKTNSQIHKLKFLDPTDSSQKLGLFVFYFFIIDN